MEFHAGSFKLAEKSHSLIIPVTQNNTSAIFEDQKPFLKKAHTVIEFGTPVDMSLMSPDEKKNVAAYIHDIILSTYEKTRILCKHYTFSYAFSIYYSFHYLYSVI